VVYCSIMPRVSIDYSKTIIYRIVCKDPTIKDCYIGETTDFKSRKSKHKSTCNNIQNKDYNCNVYQFIRNNGGWNNWDMIQIEHYNAIDKLDAHKRERYWIETLKSTLNMIIPSRSEKEYYVDNRSKILNYKKIYHQTHKDERNEYNKKYREEHKDELNEYSKNYCKENRDERILYNKKYYENHKVIWVENNKKYREEHKDELNEYNKKYYEDHKEENREENNRKARERYHRKKEQNLMALNDIRVI